MSEDPARRDPSPASKAPHQPHRPHQIVEADLTWVGGAFQAGIQVEVDIEGLIVRVGPGLGRATERLEDQALVPGMVNAHSHAFQRGLRGRGERYDEGSSDFWSWRTDMYALVDQLNAEKFHRLSKIAFEEMLRSGVTSVGEFHYLHHLPGSRGYELDEAIVEAARESGIRLRLLDACYLSGDVEAPLSDSQKRFASRDVDEFLASVDELAARLGPRQSLGLVAHSIRAVGIDDIAVIHQQARDRGVPFHMHVEEQQREIDACVAVYAARPLALLLDKLELGPEFTAVHCTHSAQKDLLNLIETGANICLCPLTEANLADGLVPETLHSSSANLSIGSDSNQRIDFSEELRLLEYGARLARRKRGIYLSESGSLVRRLWQTVTDGGARSLGLPVGKIEVGRLADLFTLDLNHQSLQDVEEDDLLAAFLFGASSDAIRRVAVGGEWIR